MARTRKAPEAEPGVRVREVPIDGTREFVTIGPGHPVWGGMDAVALLSLPRLGAFVRIEPPPEATEAAVAAVLAWCEQNSLRASLVPRRRPSEVVAPREKREHRKARDVVWELVGESGVGDKGALRDFCEAVMQRAGI